MFLNKLHIKFQINNYFDDVIFLTYIFEFYLTFFGSLKTTKINISLYIEKKMRFYFIISINFFITSLRK